MRQWTRDVASGADRHLDITFGLQKVESSSFISVLFREMFSHPYISFFHILVNGFCVTSFRTVLWTTQLPYIGGQEGIKMASASTPSSNEPAKDFNLVNTVTLKPIIKAQIRGNLVSSCTSNVAFASVHSEKTRLKKLLIMIIIMKKLQEMTVFTVRQKLTYTMKLRPEK